MAEGLPTGRFVGDGGSVKIAKLVGALLGSLWLTVVGGWITFVQAIATVHIRVLDALASMYVRIIRAVGTGGAETIRVSWTSAFRAASEANPLFTPILFSLEIAVVAGLLVWARRRWVS